MCPPADIGEGYTSVAAALEVPTRGPFDADGFGIKRTYSCKRAVVFLLLLLFKALANHLVDCTSFSLGDSPDLHFLLIFEDSRRLTLQARESYHCALSASQVGK